MKVVVLSYRLIHLVSRGNGVDGFALYASDHTVYRAL